MTPLSHLLENLTGMDIQTGIPHAQPLTLRTITIYDEFIKKLCFENTDGVISQREFGFTDLDQFWICEVDETNQRQKSRRDPNLYNAVQDIVSKLQSLDPTPAAKYYDFMLNSHTEFADFTCTSAINLDEIKPAWGIFNEQTKHDKACLCVGSSKSFSEISSWHLLDIFKRSMDKTVRLPIVFLSESLVAIDEYEFEGGEKSEVGDENDRTAQSMAKPIQPTSLGKTKFSKFTNYLNFCKFYNIPSKLQLFKGYSFYVCNRIQKNDSV